MELDLLVELIGRRVADHLEIRFCSWEQETKRQGYRINFVDGVKKLSVFLTTEFIKGTELHVITAFIRALIKREIIYVESVF